MSDILSVAEKGVSHGVALGADQVEVYVAKQMQTRISVRRAHVIGGDVVEMGGAGVRVYVGGALGVSATSRLGEVKGAVERAYKLAKGTISDPEFRSLPGPAEYGAVEGLYDEGLAGASFEELTEGFMEGVKVATGDGGLTVSGSLTRSVGEVAVVNSLGVECRTKGTSIGGSIGTKAERGEDVAMGRGPIIGRSLEEFKPVEAGEEAAEKALARLGAKKVSTGTMDLILDFRSARGSVGGVLGAGVNGLSVALGNSFLSDNIGDEVASPILTVVDDPFVPGGAGSRAFDAEGAPATRLKILDEGVLKTFVTDSYSAGRLGISNTGNASRRGLTAKPVPSLTNIQVSPGSLSLDEMISETKRGILMEDGGLRVRPSSTNISSMVNSGHYIEDGEVVHPVKNTMVGTTVFEFLRNVEGLTREVLLEGGSSSPALKLREIKVSGGR